MTLTLVTIDTINNGIYHYVVATRDADKAIDRAREEFKDDPELEIYDFEAQPVTMLPLPSAEVLR